MAAIFYTSHRMKNDVQTIFQQWLQATRLRIQQRGGIKERKKPGAIDQNLRAVPAIEIDTELANQQYENQNELEQMQLESDQMVLGNNANMISPDSYENECL